MSCLEEDALVDGLWILRNLVLVWVADDPASDAPTTVARTVHDLIACPTCRARVDETCRTNGGHTTTPHTNRLAPRLCPCGDLLARQRRLCNTCRDARSQASKNRHLRRLRACGGAVGHARARRENESSPRIPGRG